MPKIEVEKTYDSYGVINNSTVPGNNVSEALEYLNVVPSTVLYVDGNRTETYIEDGSFPRPFKTIMGAINSVTDASNDKRYMVDIVGGKTYSENITMKAYVYLRSSRVAVITNATDTHTIVFPSMSSTARIENLIIRNNSANATDAAVYVGTGGNLGAFGCSITGSSGDGVQASGNNALVLESCVIGGYDYAITAAGSGCLVVATNCFLTGYTYDVSVTSPANFKFGGCIFSTGGITGTGTITRYDKSVYILNDTSFVGITLKDAINSAYSHTTSTSNPHAVTSAQAGAVAADGVAKMTVGSSAPSSPIVGDVWIDTGDTALTKVTDEGGFAIKLTAGENLSKGEVVALIQGGTDNQVLKTPTGGNENDMPIGVVYADALSGANVWVVVSGVAKVLPQAADTAARGYHLSASTSTAGRVAQAATVPVEATHFREIGHWIDTGSGAGVITRAVIHFN